MKNKVENTNANIKTNKTGLNLKFLSAILIFVIIILLLSNIILTKQKSVLLSKNKENAEYIKILERENSELQIENYEKQCDDTYPRIGEWLPYYYRSENPNLLTISENLAIKMPADTSINNDFLVTIGNSIYVIHGLNPNKGSDAGLCPWEDDSTGCGYSDEENIANVKTLRIWKDNQGVFALNPQSIKLEKNYIKKFIIAKQYPNKYFTQEEILTWKEILKTIQLIEN
jgi:hypothetical protein